MEEAVRRLGLLAHTNPWSMWRDQSPRQVLELLKSYKDMNTEATETEGSEGTKRKYTVKGNKKVKIPSWYTVPDGAVVHHADDVFQGDI